MNQPITPPQADHDIGPLDEHGQQIWSPEEEAAIAQLEAQPWFQEDLQQAYADEAAGRFISMEESEIQFDQMRQRWLSERGLV